ncbi:MAG: sensor histidine kinase [Actinomycetota bacterium]
MSTLAELVREQTDLSDLQVEKLHRLLAAWPLIADLSFADLLLWCPLRRGQGFLCVGQIRPVTAQTLHPEDVFGKVVRPEELPIIDRALAEGRSWRREHPLLIDGVQIRMEATPVLFGGRVIAVMTKEGSPLLSRRPGRLEHSYLECAAALTLMVQEGTFPFEESFDPETAPRVGDGFLRIDQEGRVLYASPNAASAYRRLGVLSSVVGERLGEIGVEASPARAALQLGVPAEGEIQVGTTVVLQQAIPFLQGPDRHVVGGMVLLRDVTELRRRERMLERKDAVIQEIHHRVKNNLQTIASLLRIQARRLASSEARAQLEEAVRRIAAIAVVHETLAHDTQETVEFAKVGRRLVRMVADGLTHPDRKLQLSFEGEPGDLPADIATPLAVALVELLQNAVEHAFGSTGGWVAVRMGREAGRVRLSVEDNGRGLPPGFSMEDAGLGLQIVRALVETELGGAIRIGSDSGTRITLDLPVRRPTSLRPLDERGTATHP